jgi:uncharacterized protein (TIRG00374 family)
LNTRYQPWITLAVALAVCASSAVLLAFLLRDLDWTLISGSLPRYLVLVLLLSVVGTGCYAIAVYLLVRASGYRTTLVQAYLVLTASLSMNYVTPVKVGIPLRVYLYRHFMGIPAATGTALITLEALLGMVVPALIAIVGTASLFPFIGLLQPMVLLVIVGSVFAATMLFPFRRIKPFIRRLPFQRAVKWIASFGRQVQISLRNLPAWALLSTTILIILNLTAVAMRLYLVLQMLGHAVSPVSLLYVQAMAVTAGNLSMIPMGLGVRDASFVLLLAQLGVPNEIVLSVGVIERLFSPGWTLLLGLISTNVLGVSEIVQASRERSCTGDELG